MVVSAADAIGLGTFRTADAGEGSRPRHGYSFDIEQMSISGLEKNVNDR
jgi:hypothetical protein